MNLSQVIHHCAPPRTVCCAHISCLWTSRSLHTHTHILGGTHRQRHALVWKFSLCLQFADPICPPFFRHRRKIVCNCMLILPRWAPWRQCLIRWTHHRVVNPEMWKTSWRCHSKISRVEIHVFVAALSLVQERKVSLWSRQQMSPHPRVAFWAFTLVRTKKSQTCKGKVCGVHCAALLVFSLETFSHGNFYPHTFNNEQTGPQQATNRNAQHFHTTCDPWTGQPHTQNTNKNTC